MGVSSPDQEQCSVSAAQDSGTVIITVRGHLDGSAGGALLQAATVAVGAKGACRLDIDLRALDSFTPEGADALVACRAVGAQLPEGLHYRTGRGAGRSALLSAYRAADTAEMKAISFPDGDGASAER
jgi:acetyl-CoA carboxylase carboxyltransferase component